MTRPEYSGLAYWQNRYRELEPQLSFHGRSPASFRRWKRKFGGKFVECLGKMPSERLPLDVRLETEDESDAWTRRKITYTADRYSRVPAYLFLPKGVRFPAPAVICPHGHGRGKDDPAGIARTDADREQLRKYNYSYAEQFARHGYVTLAPDLRCFGERVDDPAAAYGHVAIEEGDHWCDITFILGMLAGFNLLSLHIFDIGRGIDLLQGLPEVIPGRIGCVGLSQGGTTTLFSAAFHHRIKVAGVSGYLNSWKVFPMVTGQICGSQIVPGLLQYGDHAEVAGLICPRPLFCEFGLRDPIFPIAGARAAWEKVRAIYGAAGAADRLEAEEFDGLHEFRGSRIFEFFRRWL